MAFTASNAKQLRTKRGTPAEIMAAEFANVQTETDSLDTTIAGGLKVAKGSLTAGAANAFAFAWQNTESSKIIVTRVILRLTTAGGTATSVIDVGPGASATTHSDTLIDGQDLNTTGIFDNVTNHGTNGLPIGCVLDENGGTTDYITGQILTANAASLAGKYYIFYTIV